MYNPRGGCPASERAHDEARRHVQSYRHIAAPGRGRAHGQLQERHQELWRATALDGLNLEFGAGEKVAIIGPSGSGKITVLRMLMTLEKINGGSISVDGEMAVTAP